MNQDRKVAAITVTFNRAETLQLTLNALLKQSIKVDKIIIADNGSDEIHKTRIKEMTAGIPQIEVVWLSENLGGAGGFEAGMRYAKEKYDPDWYWLMDDDACPREDTLEKLLQHRTLPGMGALLPVIYGVDWKKYQLYHAKVLCKNLTREEPKFQNIEEMQAVEEVDANAFVGPLFPKKVVEEFGFVDGGLFIYGDDTEYTTRIHRKYKLYLVKAAVMDHKDPPLSNEVFSPRTYWKLYYTLRNRILLAMKYNRGPGRGMAFCRLTGEMLWQTGYSMVRSKLGKSRFLRMKMVWKAYIDGMLGRKGKTVDPVEFAKKVKKYEE